ncbi:MAG: hypothetical protein VX730_08690 [Pseudomonadota bacterium]|nr:hypothetical protein [Pseudomonadota bacterium]
MRSMEECLRRLAHGAVASYTDAVRHLEEDENKASAHATLALMLIEKAHQKSKEDREHITIVQDELGKDESFAVIISQREEYQDSAPTSGLLNELHQKLTRFDVLYVLLMRL